jgi:hypothetical protein
MDWKKTTLEDAVRTYVAALATSMSTGELDQAKRTYSTLFRHDLDALGDLRPDLATAVFSEQLNDRVQKLARLSPDARRQLLTEDTLAARVVEYSDFLEQTGEQILKGGPLTSALRARTEETCTAMNQLAKELKRHPRVEQQVGMKTSESLLDCRFLLEGGEPTSFRLHKYSEYLKLHGVH